MKSKINGLDVLQFEKARIWDARSIKSEITYMAREIIENVRKGHENFYFNVYDPKSGLGKATIWALKEYLKFRKFKFTTFKNKYRNSSGKLEPTVTFDIQVVKGKRKKPDEVSMQAAKKVLMSYIR